MGKTKKVAATLAAKKTEEKLSALASVVSTSLEDLAEAYTTSDELKTCKFHFHTPPMAVDLGKLDFMSGLSNAEAEYVRSNASSFRFFCFPKEAKKLKSICESVRRYLKSLTVGNSDYISADDFYNKFLPYLSSKKEELDALKQQIDIYYEEELKSFSDNVMSVVNAVCPQRVDGAKAAVSYITGRTKESFLDNISFDLETGFDATGASSPDLSDLLKRSKEAYVLREIEGIYVGQLQQLWDIMAHFVTIIKSAPDSLAGYQITRRAMREGAEKVEKENVGGIPIITELSSRIIALEKEENRDISNTEAFDIMSQIFGRGSEFGASFKFSEDLPDWVVAEDLMEAYEP